MGNFSLTNQQELVTQFQQIDFAEQVLAQLQKEFQKIGLELQLTENQLETYDKFLFYLKEEISILAEASPTRLHQLLYLADLPENHVNNIFKLADNPIDELSDLLLKRVASKVYFRQLYKSKKI
ncbi:MAG: hypothetical protein M9897_03385 [Brumimicrobium sp.]|nr:hypothetical protein [Brumimicrobium sp.]